MSRNRQNPSAVGARRLKVVDRHLDAFRGRRPIRAGSLIITVFCDTVSQHGNSVWLGSLIEALAPLGLNQRLIRTSVYRLVKDDWLSAEQVGRRSYYSLTEAGLRHYQKAARRIYSDGSEDWDGTWTLVVNASLTERDRDTLRRELQWLGYGTLTPGVMAHPNHDRRSLDETLQEMGVAHRVTVLSARTEDLVSRDVLRKLAYEIWKLDHLARRYDAFLSAFRPLLRAARSARGLDPEQAFQVRTLLIHEYRRILLRDADLPAEMLPPRWPGRAALGLTANLYRAVEGAARAFVEARMETADGPLPACRRGYFQRFGGL